jgi:hypothetical protein
LAIGTPLIIGVERTERRRRMKDTRSKRVSGDAGRSMMSWMTLQTLYLIPVADSKKEVALGGWTAGDRSTWRCYGMEKFDIRMFASSSGDEEFDPTTDKFAALAWTSQP